jgi:hypothetical protein
VSDVLLVEEPAVEPDVPVQGTDALFPEARRRQRRRRALNALRAATVIVCVATAVVLLGFDRDKARVGTGGRPAASLPAGGEVKLRVAGPLAVAPDGRLYVADLGRDQVLVRSDSGRFRVVAGDGEAGFSGDGGPAVRARLTDVTDLAFAPGGALYVADGGRVREVTPNGVIRTIAGNGRGSADEPVQNGVPALGAPLGSAAAVAKSGVRLYVALSPAGALYISDGTQVLRLKAGRLYSVPAIIRTGPFAGDFNGRGGLGPIAVDAKGDIYVAGLNGWSIWEITRGIAHQLGGFSGGTARRSGGDTSILQRGPNGATFGEDGSLVLRFDRNGLVPAIKFGQQVAREYFWLTYFAFSPNGSVYADEIPGTSGFESRQQLVAVPNDGAIKLLWEQPAQHPDTAGQ